MVKKSRVRPARHFEWFFISLANTRQKRKSMASASLTQLIGKYAYYKTAFFNGSFGARPSRTALTLRTGRAVLCYFRPHSRTIFMLYLGVGLLLPCLLAQE